MLLRAVPAVKKSGRVGMVKDAIRHRSAAAVISTLVLTSLLAVEGYACQNSRNAPPMTIVNLDKDDTMGWSSNI